MDIKEFETILKVGEHIGVEFKSAKGGPKDDTYETVCSFLNRFGGDILDKIISIRDVLKRTPKSSLSAIAADLDMSERIVDEYVSLLKEVGAIHRKDGKRFGEWEVLK